MSDGKFKVIEQSNHWEVYRMEGDLWINYCECDSLNKAELIVSALNFADGMMPPARP